MNKIFIKDKKIFRILDSTNEQLLVIDCIKRSLPYWVDNSFLNDYKEIDNEEFLKELKVKLPPISELSSEQLKIMYKRYGSISDVLQKINDTDERRIMVHRAAEIYDISEQTIRHRLCDYLVFQNIVVLAPKQKNERELSFDEKNFKWGLNKYFYSSKKLSLRQAYKYLIKEKYVGNDGEIVKKHPTFHQFKYFYYKTRSESNFIISRWGKGEYSRNFRPLLGDGVRDYCSSIGYGMLDSTTLDIYLVNDFGELVGRPIMTACIDAFSSLCLGYSIGFDGGINSLRKLMINVVSDKVDYCKKFGIDICKEEWNSHWLPHKLITDKGREYVGETFSQITDLGVEVINLEPFRPDLKSIVERFFGLVQSYFKKELIDKGVVLKDFGDRGAIDYRKKACLTIEEFEKILLLCIIHYNSGRTIELPNGISGISSCASSLWNYQLDRNKDSLIDVDVELLRLTLLPRTKATFRRDGLRVNGLRYRAVGFTNEYLKGEVCNVTFDPDDVSYVWLFKDDEYVKFELIERYYFGKKTSEVNNSFREKKVNRTKSQLTELESEIRLSKEIEKILSSSGEK